jgi:hypothetical protein
MDASTHPDMQGQTTRLVDVLRALPAKELNGLIDRLGIRVDAAKRLDTPSQVARALVALPDLREPARMSPSSVDLLHRVAEARGTLLVTAVPPSLEPLLARGLMFARSAGRDASTVGTARTQIIELVLPTAHVLQLRTWEGEDPRGARALLAQASFETTNAIASHYLGRPATPPIVLALEPAWEVLSDAQALRKEIEKLAPSELRVLETVEREGGEVDTEELLEIEREPLRLRMATGVSPSRRGVGSALERRGFLIPVHPNRHVVPTEVSAIVSAAHRAERAERREEVKRFVRSGDHAPRRARFATDPSPLVLALALAAREGQGDVKPNIGTPKSLTQKLGGRFGRDPMTVAMLVALSRAVGLWEPSALVVSSPPGSLALSDVPSLLFGAWRRGGAWDEAREEPEVLRLAIDARDPSPIGVVRELLLEALVELGEGWIPWLALERYLRSDHRMAGLTRLFRRWAERSHATSGDGPHYAAPIAALRRIVCESLPALGIIDTGEDDTGGPSRPQSDREEGSPAPAEGDAPEDERQDQRQDQRLMIRLTPRGRALLAGRATSTDGGAKFLDSHVLRVGPQTRIANILAIGPLVEVARCADALELLVAPQTLARALSAGLEADAVRARIEAVAPLPETLSKTLAQASVVLGRSTFVHGAGFLWVDDENIRELLRTRRATGELFVEPSPPAGLIVAPGVDVDRLSRRCRALGIEVLMDGQVVRARSIPPGGSTPPPPRTTPTPPPLERRRSSQVRIQMRKKDDE